VNAEYFYKPQGTCFRVYHRINEHEAESVELCSTIDKAKNMVYELNGWNLNKKKNTMSENESNYGNVGTQIQLVQIPVITHKLKEIGLSVTKRIEELNLDKQIVTEDTIQFLKTTRAELNKEANQWEIQRKAVKTGILSPYDEFEAIYKSEIIDKYKAADAKLKDNIGDFELKLRTEKKNNIIAYFNELCIVEGLEWLKFEKLNIDVTLSVTEKKYKEQVLEFVTKTKSDITLINSEEFAPEMLVEYKQTLNASKAITDVRTRKQKAKEEAAALKLAETGRRENSLRGLGLVYHDFTKSFNWTKDESILVKCSDIESLSKDEWINRFAVINEMINTATAKMQKPITQSSTATEVIQTVLKAPEILKAPVIETPIQAPVVDAGAMDEELFEAVFSVNETFPRLKLLQEFLQSNNYTYKNID
jgi:hypothetical protein